MPSAHVLLVDDSTTVRVVIAAELLEAGFRVHPAPTADFSRPSLTPGDKRNRSILLAVPLRKGRIETPLISSFWT